jgi:lipoprotein NlpD
MHSPKNHLTSGLSNDYRHAQIDSNKKGLAYFFSIITLFACSSRPIPAPVVDVYQGRSILDVEKNSYTAEEYKVKKGDTLYSIAWMAGLDYEELARINQIKAPYAIFPDQILNLKKIQLRQIVNAKKMTGQTTKKEHTQSVDRLKSTEYGDNKKVVKPPKSTAKQNIKVNGKLAWVWPAEGKILKTFNDAVPDRSGISIGAPFNSDVKSAAEGTVVYKGDALRGYGNLIIIKHNKNYLSAYAHTNTILVKERQKVKAGERIATVGNSDSARTMLHFEVRFKGKSVDPLRYLPKRG